MVADDSIEPSLFAGAAIYNAGDYHEAHDAWEDVWLELETGTDRDFLQGLIQCTAAIHHVSTGNWEGATGLARSALSYFEGLSDDYRGVALTPLRSTLHRVAKREITREQLDPPPMTIDDTVVTYDHLSVEAIAIAAPIVLTEIDPTLRERAITFARDDHTVDNPTSPFAALLVDLLAERQPAVAKTRLEQHVDRRSAAVDDVTDLFE